MTVFSTSKSNDTAIKFYFSINNWQRLLRFHFQTLLSQFVEKTSFVSGFSANQGLAHDAPR